MSWHRENWLESVPVIDYCTSQTGNSTLDERTPRRVIGLPVIALIHLHVVVVVVVAEDARDELLLQFRRHGR